MGFLGLEVLIHKLFEHLREPALTKLTMRGADGTKVPAAVIEPMLWEPKRSPLAARFAVVAAYLAPGSAEADHAAFRELLKVRNKISHGSPIAPEELPVAAVRELFVRYLDAAIGSFSTG